MIIDKKGRLFGKINIIDLLVISAIAVTAVGISFRFISTASENVKKTTELTYVVEIEGIRDYTLRALDKKGIVTNTKDDSVMGEIVSVEYQQSETQSVTTSGETVFAKIPERYTALITVKAEGRESDSSYFVGNNIELSVGSTISMTTKYVNSSGRVVSIQK